MEENNDCNILSEEDSSDTDDESWSEGTSDEMSDLCSFDSFAGTSGESEDESSFESEESDDGHTGTTLWNYFCLRTFFSAEDEGDVAVDIDSDELALPSLSSFEKADVSDFQIPEPDVLESERCLIARTNVRDVTDMPLIREFRRRPPRRVKSEMKAAFKKLSNCVEARNGSAILEWFHSEDCSNHFREIYDYMLLTTAVEVGSSAIFNFLLGEMFCFDEHLTPFVAALKHSNMHFVKNILDMGVDVNRVLANQRHGTLLHVIARQKKDTSNMIKFLVSLGADVTICDKSGSTSFRRAVANGSYENALALAQAGCVVEEAISSKWVLPLLCEAIPHGVKMVNLVYSFLPHLRTNSMFDEILLAIKQERISVLRYFIQKNVPLCSPSRDPQTKVDLFEQLFYACVVAGKESDLIMARLLLEAGQRPSSDALIKLNSCDDDSDTVEIMRNMVEEHMSRPPRLEHLACLKIRSIVGPSLHSLLQKVPLPKSLKDYLQLKHL